MSAPVRGDRVARYLEWAKLVLTEEGRQEFLQRVEEAGSVEGAAGALDLPSKRVLAMLAMHRELSESAAAILKLRTHELRAETLEIADESADPKLMIEARKDLSEVWNRADYGQRLKVEKSVTVGVDEALLGRAERLLGLAPEKVVSEIPASKVPVEL